MRAVKIGLVAVVAAVLAIGVLAIADPLNAVKVGGYQGTRYIEHGPDGSYEPSEVVALDFNLPVLPPAFKDALSITPAAPFSLYPRDLGKQITIKFRKTPGVTYRLRVAAGLRAVDGAALAAPIDVTVKTADAPIPKPLRAAPNEPYRYGVLAHPYPVSLGGPNAERMVATFAAAGVRFVRIDYCGDQSEALGEGRFDWSVQDKIAALLAAKGITELPIVDQYCAPKWANGGFGYPAIWQNPEAYAGFAAAVAAHVALHFPKITRIELFNEPNLQGWWTNKGDPAYAGTDGVATAQYMRAAYAAVKKAAPAIAVVGPALAAGGHEVDPRQFFEAMYAAGCKRGACWDVLSVHNYRWENPTFPQPAAAPNRFDIYKTILDIAAKHGDAGTHVMLTEWGYSTIDAPDGVDPRTQALYVALGFNAMLADPSVDGIVYVNMYNAATDFWGQTALVTPDFAPKPGYDVFRTFATAR